MEEARTGRCPGRPLGPGGQLSSAQILGLPQSRPHARQYFRRWHQPVGFLLAPGGDDLQRADGRLAALLQADFLQPTDFS